MTKFTACVSLTILLLSLSAGQLRAQGAGQATPAAAPSDPLQVAASSLFKALADNDLAVTAQNTSMKYARRLTAAALRPAPTGPKLKAAFDGSVTVVRKGTSDAVVEAKIFTADSSDVPVGEISRVRIYMVQEGGDWKASAANKKQAQSDADMNGGWYHAAFFTFCPNRGLVFVPNHFSRDLECRTVAQCRF